MIVGLTEPLVQKVFTFLTPENLRELSLVNQSVNQQTYGILTELWEKDLRAQYQEYWDSTGVDPEAAFGSISEHVAGRQMVRAGLGWETGVLG